MMKYHQDDVIILEIKIGDFIITTFPPQEKVAVVKGTT